MMPWLQNPNAPKQPGLGQQLGQKVASDFAAKEAAKLGLGAAGTAVAGPLGGIAGNAAGELAGPLASQLVGQLFNEGGAVYKNEGGFSNPWIARLVAAQQAHLRNLNTPKETTFAEQVKLADPENTYEVLDDKGQSLRFAEEEEKKAPVVSPRSKASATWDIPLGEFLGGKFSTSGSYSDMDTGKDPWSAGIKGTWSFDKGGEVPSGKKNSIWDTIKDAAGYAWKNENKLHDSYAAKLNKKPQYKAIGGMTSGPLGMSDALAAGKDTDISKVKIKKNKGDMSEEVEFNYHAPLAPKPTGE